MAIYGHIFQFFLQIISENIMKVDNRGRKFKFIVWLTRDMKCQSAQMQHVGQSSNFPCVQCYWDKRHPELEAPPRSIETHNALAVLSQINHERLDAEELYEFCKGTKGIAISPPFREIVK